MRIARLLGAILTILTASGLLLAPPAGAEPPFRLSGYITDNAGALSGSGRATVRSAIDKLYADRHVRLWVVYVDDFSGQSAENWAKRTCAPATWVTTTRCWPCHHRPRLRIPGAVHGAGRHRNSGRQPAPRSDRTRATRRQLERRGARRGQRAQQVIEFVRPSAAADCARRHRIAVVVLLVVMRYRTRRRRAAELAAARRVDPTDRECAGRGTAQALDDLSRSKVVEVDNAVRTSSNELALAIEEFGERRTEPFTTAVNNAKTALSQAFEVRHQLDDGTARTPAQRRELLTRVIVSAALADRELESQTEAFEKLRDLVINAPSLLDGLTGQYVELTARIAPAEQRLAELHNEFDAAALTSVVRQCRGRQGAAGVRRPQHQRGP